jgi:hypothetical protein
MFVSFLWFNHRLRGICCQVEWALSWVQQPILLGTLLLSCMINEWTSSCTACQYQHPRSLVITSLCSLAVQSAAAANNSPGNQSSSPSWAVVGLCALLMIIEISTTVNSHGSACPYAGFKGLL